MISPSRRSRSVVRKLAIAVAQTLITAALMLTLTAHAQAGPAPQSMSAVPACVEFSVEQPNTGMKILRLTNNCSYPMRVRIDVSPPPVLACVSMTPGQRLTFQIPPNWTVVGLSNCL